MKSLHNTIWMYLLCFLLFSCAGRSYSVEEFIKAVEENEMHVNSEFSGKKIEIKGLVTKVSHIKGEGVFVFNIPDSSDISEFSPWEIRAVLEDKDLILKKKNKGLNVEIDKEYEDKNVSLECVYSGSVAEGTLLGFENCELISWSEKTERQKRLQSITEDIISLKKEIEGSAVHLMKEMSELRRAHEHYQGKYKANWYGQESHVMREEYQRGVASLAKEHQREMAVLVKEKIKKEEEYKSFEKPQKGS